MQMSIQGKLIALGVISIAALCASSSLGYMNNQKLVQNNELLNKAREAQMLNYDMRNKRLQMFLSNFEALYLQSRGTVAEDVLKTARANADVLSQDMQKIIELKPAFVDQALLQRAKAETAIVTTPEIADMIRAHAQPLDIDTEVAHLNPHRLALKDMLVALDRQIEDAYTKLDQQNNTIITQSNTQMLAVGGGSIAVLFAFLVFLVLDDARRERKAAAEKRKALQDMAGSFEASVKSVAGATTQLSSAMAEIGRQVSRASSVASAAVSESRKADDSVRHLSEAAQKISEVVKMTGSIASQINLLGLNATIEAARAGDAGKGFSAVASEVKNVAVQTAKATEQFGQYISSLQSATGEAVGMIKSISGTIRELSDISAAIASAVEEQRAVTKDIAGDEALHHEVNKLLMNVRNG